VIKDELKNSLMLKNNMKEVAAQDWLSAAVSYASQGGRFKQALVCIDSAIEMDTNDANAWALKAAIQVARGENQAALQSAEQATRIDPKNVRALNSKANALAALGRDPEALTIIEEALAYQPINPPVLFTKVVILYNKGLALATAGNLNEALKCYDEALEGAKNKDIESKPEIAKVWFGRGSVLGLMERRVEALASLDRAIQIDPSHVEAWVHKGLETYQLGDGEKALEYLNKALELDGRSAMAWHNKAVVLHGLKRFEDALACCERTTDLDPSNALVWLQKARALQGLGRSNAEITAAVKKAASLGNPDAIELLSNSPGK
jgi:tetratricopeptide (TPR) repeat protein